MYDSPIGAVFQNEKGRKSTGQIKLKQGSLLDSVVVNFVDDEYFHISCGSALHGISELGKVSLIDCVSGGQPKITSREDFKIFQRKVSFRYALFGREHVSVDQSCIRGVQFNLKELENSVFMQNQSEEFGLFLDPADEIIEAISQKRPDYQNRELIKGQAMVSYFTGNTELLSQTDTALGTVSVVRSVDFNLYEITNTSTFVTIDFDDSPATIDEAWDKIREVRQFFGWIMGFAPSWKDVRLFTSRLGKKGYHITEDGRPDVGILAFGPNEWVEQSGRNHDFATLIDATKHQEHFRKIMRIWFDRNQNVERRNANIRYFGTLRGMIGQGTVEDRVVSAANTFDLLPTCDKPKRYSMSKTLSEILHDTRNRIRSECTHSYERDEVLNSLGRIETGATLRNVVEHRAKVIEAKFNIKKLVDLKQLIRQAVYCRNYYTHGSSGKTQGTLDFSDPRVVLFLTRTLEFIYATSELVLCEWNANTALRFDRHPLGTYLLEYDHYRSLLKLE